MGRTNSSDELNLIAQGTTIEGKVNAVGGFRIDGKFNGDLTVNESVVVGGSGDIDGTLVAKNATVGGKFTGTLKVAGKLVLQPGARVHGDITAAVLVVDEGAMFDGCCKMSAEPGAAPVDIPAENMPERKLRKHG